MGFDFKNASRAELENQFFLLAQQPHSAELFTKKELYHLPEIVSAGEQIIAYTSGLMSGNTWLIALTDRRVIFLDKGIVYGLKQVIIDLDKINAVSCKTGLMFGEIAITDGASTKKISNVPKATAAPFAAKIQEALESRKQVRHAAPEPTDVVSLLERLAALRDRGILTDDEFAAQKDIILAKASS